MRNRIRHVGVFLVVLAWGSAASAQPPPDVNYQGRLLDSAGQPLAGPVDLQIRIFDQLSDGIQLYTEDHQGVPLVDGVFNVLLGTGTNPQGSFDAQLFEGTNRWLEVVVQAEVLEPRQPFSSVAYAFQSQRAQTAADAELLGGFDSSALDQSAHVGDAGNPHGVTAAQVGATTSGEMDAAIATHAGDASAHHAKTTSFGELTDQVSDGQIPDAVTRDSELNAELARKSDVSHDHDPNYLRADVNTVFAGPQLSITNGSELFVDGSLEMGPDVSVSWGGETLLFDGTNGRFEVSADLQAEGYEFLSPAQKYLGIPVAKFVLIREPPSGIGWFRDLGGYGYLFDAGGNPTADLIASVDLPSPGTVINSLTCYHYDNAFIGNLSYIAALRMRIRTLHGTTIVAEINASSTFASSSIVATTEAATDGPIAVVDNETREYYITLSWNPQAFGEGLRFYGCRVGYLVERL